MEYMTIREAAKKLGVETHVLRYWEEELGLLIKRNEMGHRCYDERDIQMFCEIQQLKERGFLLKDIREGIKGRLKEKSEDKKNPDEYKTGEKRPDEKNVEEHSREKGWKNERDSETEEKGQETDSRQGDFVSSVNNPQVVDFKLAQLQSIMNRVVANALRENKGLITDSIKAEITTDVIRQFDTVMREKDEREEERFRKLDENLRRLQQANEEVAATKMKRRKRGFLSRM